MTFLNSAGLLKSTADVVKTAASNVPSQDIQANQSDEFAKALRKQMQQANKPVNNVAAPVDSKNSQPAKDALKAPSAQEPAKTVKNDSAAKEQTKTTSSQSEEKNTKNVSDDQGQSVEETSASTEAPAINETALDRKKRLLANLETADPAASGLTPWAQTMMAMRPSGGQGIASDKGGVSVDGTETSLQSGDLLTNASATTMTDEALSEQSSALNIPAAGVGPEAKQLTTAVDPKLSLAEGSQTAVGDKPANFSETLGIAKAVADSAREALATDKTVDQAGNIDMQSETSNNSTLPVAQALPNSPWLTAAGVSQNANVFMSQVATPFGNERWQTAMNQHVLNMVGSGDDVASLTLSPPDLGPIQVVLKVDNQSVNANFITDNPLVRQALEDGLQDLRDRMASQGLELGQTFVGNGQQAQQHFDQQSANGSSRIVNSSTDSDAIAEAGTPVTARVSRGLVDTFA